MKQAIKARVIGGKVSTAVGGILATAIVGATKYGEASGWDMKSWQGYAVAAAVAVAGAAYKKAQQ